MSGGGHAEALFHFAVPFGGRHVSGRATRNMDRYLIRRDGGDVVVDLHKWVQSDKDPAAWAAAAVAV